MAKFFAFAALVVGLIAVADIITHPEGVKAAGGQLNSLWGTTTKALNPPNPRYPK